MKNASWVADSSGHYITSKQECNLAGEKLSTLSTEAYEEIDRVPTSVAQSDASSTCFRKSRARSPPGPATFLAGEKLSTLSTEAYEEIDRVPTSVAQSDASPTCFRRSRARSPPGPATFFCGD